MRQGGVEYAPAGFHATGDGSDGRGQLRHQSQMQQHRNQASAPTQGHIAQLPQSFADSKLQTDEAQPNKRRKLNSESTQTTIIDRALTRADNTHRKSNGWPAMPPPDMNLPQFVNPRDLLLRPVTVRPEFNWDNKFLFQSRVFEQDELVPIRPVGRPLGSRKQQPPSSSRSNFQAAGGGDSTGAARQNADAPSRIVVLPGVITPTAAPRPSRQQQQYAIPTTVPQLEESQYKPLPAAAPPQKRRDSGAQIHLDGSNDTEAEPESPTTSAYPTSQARPLPRTRTMSISSDTGSVYSDHSARSNSPAPPPSSTAASSPPKPLPTPKKTAANKPHPTTPAPMKKKGNRKYIQPSRQTTNLPHSPPPNVQFIPGTRAIPSEISSLVQRLKSATRKENFPQRTSLRRFEEFDSRYGYLKRSSTLWKEWFGDTRLFTEKWWRFFAMTGKGQELGRGDEDEQVGGEGYGDGAGEEGGKDDMVEL